MEEPDGDRPPGFACNKCGEPVVNLAGEDAKYPEARCLSREMIKKILEADAYQKAVDTGEHPDVPNPPDYEKTKGRGKHARSVRDNARAASAILKKWTDRVECMKRATARYIVANDEKFEDVRKHLQEHFSLTIGTGGTVTFGTTAEPTENANDAHFVDAPVVIEDSQQPVGDDLGDSQTEQGDAPPDDVRLDGYSYEEIVSFVDEDARPDDVRVDSYSYDEIIPLVDETAGYGYDDVVSSIKEVYVDELNNSQTLQEEQVSEQVQGYSYEEIVALLAELYVNQPSNTEDAMSQDANLQETLEKPSVRMCFAIAKATIPLNDSVCSKLMTIFNNVKPDNYDDMITDGRYLAPPDPEYLRQMKLRKTVCGLTKENFVPFHKQEKRDEMMRRYETTGTTIDTSKGNFPEGDIMDFDVDKVLLLESPGNLNPKGYKRLLERVHAARPNLLSPDLLYIVDKGKFFEELRKPNDDRPKKNLFSLMIHSDGVQIAKNSSLPECSPISFAIDRICPFDPSTGAVDEARALVIPSTMLIAQTISVYHGKGTADLFQYMEHFKSEMCRLSPSLHIVERKGEEERKLTVSHRLTIADSVERSKRTG